MYFTMWMTIMLNALVIDKIILELGSFNFGLNTFFILIFVVFVADDPHFERMFKMVLIFIKCLK